MEKPRTARSDPASRRAYTRWHYSQNADLYKARSSARRPLQRDRIRQAIAEYLADKACIGCGEADPVVLEFDHRENKEFNIGEAVRRGVGLKRLLAEMDKCDIRCANCHRRKTYRERGFTHRG